MLWGSVTEAARGGLLPRPTALPARSTSGSMQTPCSRGFPAVGLPWASGPCPLPFLRLSFPLLSNPLFLQTSVYSAACCYLSTGSEPQRACYYVFNTQNRFSEVWSEFVWFTSVFLVPSTAGCMNHPETVPALVAQVPTEPVWCPRPGCAVVDCAFGKAPPSASCPF